MKNIYPLFSSAHFAVLVFFLIACQGVVQAQAIFSNPITGTNPNTSDPYTTGQTVNANLTVSGIGRGAGINGTNANNRYNANGWNTPNLDLDAYFEWVITPNADFQIDFVSLVYTGQRSTAGPTSFALRSSADAFASNIGAPTATGATIALSAAAFQGVTSAITFRLYGWGNTNSGGTFSVNDFTFNGTVAPIPMVSIEATDADAAEAGPATGTFRISRTGSTTAALEVSYTIGGSASSADYAPMLSGTVTIPAGESFTDLTITPVDDDLVEGTETLTLTLVDGAAYDLSADVSATVNIEDNDFAYLTVSPSTASVNEGAGVYTSNIRLLIDSSPAGGTLQDAVTVQLVGVELSATFDDFTLMTPSVTFPAGSGNGATQPFEVTIVDDNLVEGNEFFDVAMVQTGYTGVPSIVQDNQVIPGFCNGNNNDCRNRQTIRITDNDLPDYTITTTGNAIVITDVAGNGEALEVTENGTNIRFNAIGRIYTINGGAGIAFPANVPLAAAVSITINAAGGNDIINIGAFTANLPSLTINGGTGDDVVNFNGDITFATDANLDVDMQNDDATPGEDQVTVAADANLVLSGTGAATVKVSRNVEVNSGGSIETEDGNLTIEANQQATPTGGSFVGVNFIGGGLDISGSGNLDIKGKGGTGASNQSGVRASAEAIISGGAGSVSIIGVGGNASGNDANGVMLTGNGTTVNTKGGNVYIEGTSVATQGVRQYGIHISTGALVTAGSAGSVTVEATAGLSVSNINSGIRVGNGGTITSSGGNVTVTGTGRGSSGTSRNDGVRISDAGVISAGPGGDVEVTGTGGFGFSHGVRMNNAGSLITSNDGNVTVTGFASSDGEGSYGIHVLGGSQISAGGAGKVTVEGTSASQNDNSHGVVVEEGGSLITSSGGDVEVTGTGTGNAADILTLLGGMITSTSTTAGITLHSTTNGTWPNTAGTDVSTSATQTTTFGIGSKLNIDIDGLTANTEYQQLGVVGTIDLNGAELTFAGSTHTPAIGETFTIVDNDGVDAIIGTFQGLPERAVITDFLGSSLEAFITYTGGDGNDVVLTVIENNYVITTTAGALVITEATDNGETLEVTDNGNDIRFNAADRFFRLYGGPTTAMPADVPLPGITSITINTEAGNDIINIGAFTANLPDLTINGGTGDDVVNFNGDITFAADANLDVDLQNDDATPGVDRVIVAANNNLVLSGTGAATIKVSRNMEVNSGGSIETENGDLTIEANQQATPTGGSFMGIKIDDAVVKSVGSGLLTLKSKGGNSGGTRDGIIIRNGAEVMGGTGKVSIEGAIGNTSNFDNYGVYVGFDNSKITSLGGDVEVKGFGGSRGVYVQHSEISAGAMGKVSIEGMGDHSGSSYGVYVLGTDAKITSAGGDVQVKGTGGGNGSGNCGVYVEDGEISASNTGKVSVEGTGGVNGFGVQVNGSSAKITSAGGDVEVKGIGGGTGITNYGVAIRMNGEISAGGMGKVSVEGTGGSPLGESNYAVYLSNSKIISVGGDVEVKGIGGGSGASRFNYGVYVLGDSEIAAGGTGSVSVEGTGGNASGIENDGVLVLGSNARIASSQGAVHISGQGGTASSDIRTEAGGLISSTSGSITLHSTTNGTWPNTAGTDVSTGATQTTTFGTGSKLNIDIDGTTPNAQYQQLSVIGGIDLNGAELTFVGSTHTPAIGNTFTIVDNDGVDAIIGTFNGLPEGERINDFLGSGLDARITYEGGDGNDVVITVLPPCTTITFTATPTGVSCSTSSDGQITISGETDGTAPYMYSIDDGMTYQSGATFTGLAADTYQVKIKDVNDCESDAEAVVVAAPTCPATGTLTWTGAADTDWSNPCNWDAGCVPTADNEVVIPDVANAPIITTGTAALAKAVNVQPNASLTLEAMSSLTLEGASGTPSGGMYNQGTVTNNGQIDIGPSISPGEYGLVNEGMFSNEAGSELSIDRSSNIGLWNSTSAAELANAGKITVGAVVGTNSRPGIYNEGDIQNNGGEIEIDRYGGAGIDNRPNGTISNSGMLAIGQLSGPLGTCIYNFGHIQNLAAGEIKLDNGNSGIFTTTTGGVSSSFTNAGKIAIGQIANIGGPGIYNRSASDASASFENKADGEILIDRFSVGIHNDDNCAFDNAGLIKIATTVMGTGFSPAIYNRSTFNNYAGAEIQIDRISRTGLQHDKGIFTNGGKIIVGINVTIANLNPGVYNQATFVNQEDAEMHIDRFTHVGFQNAFNSSMTNAGLIKIGENVLGGNNGLYNDGTFENQATGEIHVDNIPDANNTNGVFNAFGDTFTNAGKLFIGSAVGGGSTGLFNSGAFGNSGEITVDNIRGTIGRHGLYHSNGTFTNTGKIDLGATGSLGSFGIYTSSTFNNEADGEIAIDRCDIAGLRNGNFTPGGPFTNAGKITIGANASVGDWGLWNNSNFTNSGELNIDNAAVTGLRHQSATFINTGTVALGGIASSGEWALWNQSAFHNEASGEISIDRSSNTGLLNFLNTFTNEGVITIGADAAVGDQALYNEATFDNEACAVLNIFAPLHNVSTFTNAGLLYANTLAAHTNMGFANAGVIAYPKGNPIPNVTNDEIIVAPVTSSDCSIVSPAFTLVSPVDFDILGVFTDEAGTLSAGTYVTVGNTFTPTASLAEGTFNYFVQINDPVGGCTRTVPWNLTTEDCAAISGNIVWEHDLSTPVDSVTVTLSGDDTGSDATDVNGDYAIPTAGGSSLTLTPEKTGLPYQGVDAADVARIQQHVTFIDRFDDGYKVIAADVNQSNSVTGLDAAVLFHAINGNPNAEAIFEDPSWRFVDSTYTFMDENAPWPFPEDISLTNVMADVINQSFVGVKMGDVNGTWATPMPLLLAPALNWAIPDVALKAGQRIRVPFRANGLPDVAAWQFALRFDTDYLRFERALPTAAFPLKDENFGAWQADRGELRSVFAVPQGLVLPKDEAIFELEFQVVYDGLQLSEVLSLDNGILDGRVYNTALNGGAVALTFEVVETRRIASLLPGEAALGFALEQNIPNPFSNETLIRFQLPEAGEAAFSVHDVQGRLLYEQRGYFDAGLHEVRLDALRLGAAGVLSYTLRSGAHSATQRMVLVR